MSPLVWLSYKISRWRMGPQDDPSSFATDMEHGCPLREAFDVLCFQPLSTLRRNATAPGAGEYLPVEFYLAQQPALRDDASGVVDLIILEIFLREEKGETPDADEYYHASTSMPTS